MEHYDHGLPTLGVTWEWLLARGHILFFFY